MTRITLIPLLLLPLTLAAQTFGFPWLLKPTLTGIDELSYGWGGKRFIIAKKDGKSGLFTSSGEPVLPLEYDRITMDYAGVSLGTKNGQRLWYDDRGKSFGDQVEAVISLKDGRYAVQKNNRWGVMNHKLKVVQPFEFTMEETMPHFILARKEERIDLGPAITPDGGQAGELHEIDLSDDWPGATLYRDPKTSKKGIMGKDGKPVTPAIYNFTAMHPAGYAVASPDNKKWGILARDGRTVADFQYDEIGKINDQLTAPFRKDGKPGILDAATGQVLVELGTYEGILTANKVYDYFIIVKNGLQGICDARGKVLVPPMHEKAYKMGPYLFVAEHLKSEFPQRGLFGLDGREVFKPDSVKLWVFDNGTLFVERPDGRAQHLEVGGRVLHTFEPETAKLFANNWIVEENGDSTRFYHANSTPEQPVVFDEVSDPEEGLHRVRKGELYGYVHNSGKVLAPPVLEAASAPDDEYLYVKYQGKWGVLKNTYY